MTGINSKSLDSFHLTNHIDKIQITQINLQRAQAATAILGNLTATENTNLFIIQEPYVKNNRILGIPGTWNQILSNNNKAAIVITNNNIKLITQSIKENMVAVIIEDSKGEYWQIISAYTSPTEDIEILLTQLDQFLSRSKHKLIIGGDFNAHSMSWGYKNNDERGKILEEFIAQWSLIILNDIDSPPTFYFNSKQGWPDLTLTNEADLLNNSSWKVIEEDSLSDHRYINFTLNNKIERTTFRRFKTKHNNLSKFQFHLNKEAPEILLSLNNIYTKEQLEASVWSLLRKLQLICRNTIKTKKVKQDNNKRWWNQALEMKRKQLQALRRRIQHTDGMEKEKYQQQFRKQRALYKKEVLQAKRNYWKHFCNIADDVYGKQFKTVFSKSSYPLTTLPLKEINPDDDPETIARTTLEQLLPDATPQPLGPITGNYNNDPQITEYEIEDTLKTTNSNKAPGFDGIDFAILKALHRSQPTILHTLFNKCLQLKTFPEAFKQGLVIFFPKDGKPIDDISSYRPIVLLPSMGKLLEKILTTRATFHLENNGEINSKQHGFRAEHSTETALKDLLTNINNLSKTYKHVVALSIDIKGAFDSLQHISIMNALNKTSIPRNIREMFQSFLQGRKILLETGTTYVSRNATKGCAQGSCSGPLCWNIVANNVLSEDWPLNTIIQAYADDFVILVAANTRKELEKDASETLTKFHTWATSEKLNISANKTTACLFSSLKRKPKIVLSGLKIKVQDDFKYLGIYIDKKLSWYRHIKYLRIKAEALHRRLYRLGGVNWGVPKKFKVHIYKNVVLPSLYYAASAWGQHLNTKHIRLLDTIQRKFLLNITNAYRTTSTIALQVITGILPLHLTIKKKSAEASILRLNTDITVNGNLFSTNDYEKLSSTREIHPSISLSGRIITEGLINYNTEDIYTDGSGMETGKGAALIHQNYSAKFKLKDNNSVYQAELFAIEKALQYIKDNNLQVNICTDSMSSMQAIANLRKRTKQTNNIQLLLLEQTTNLIWTKAHVGIWGNEEADKKAKESTINGIPANHIPLPASFLKSSINRIITEEWQSLWEEDDRSRRTFQAIPRVTTKQHSWTRNEIMFLTGHGPFPSYLHRFKVIKENYCACGQIGEPDHYLTTCPLTASWWSKTPAITSYDNWRQQQWSEKAAKSKIIGLMDFIQTHEDLIIQKT